VLQLELHSSNPIQTTRIFLGRVLSRLQRRRVPPDDSSFKRTYIVVHCFKYKCNCNMNGTTVETSLKITDMHVVGFGRLRMICSLACIDYATDGNFCHYYRKQIKTARQNCSILDKVCGSAAWASTIENTFESSVRPDVHLKGETASEPSVETVSEITHQAGSTNEIETIVIHACKLQLENAFYWTFHLPTK
jgi:hypothetical protein